MIDLLDTVAKNYNPQRKGFIRPATNKIETWLNARFAYCFSIYAIKGDSKAAELASLAIHTLENTLFDEINGGWFDDDSKNTRKNAYPHAFVLLASVFGIKANIERSELIFNEITNTITNKFWDSKSQTSFESFAADWTNLESYRGANSNMHMTEAFLAAYDLTKDAKWLERALAITKRITSAAEDFHFRIPEHFNPDWTVHEAYNLQNPKDPFRPFGSIPGHWFEWARLCLHLFHATGQTQSWLEQAAINLYLRAKKDSFHNEGFHYTTDFQGNPIIKLRMHWVLCEAISAAAVFNEHFKKTNYQTDLNTFWDIANKYFVRPGYWIHELDEKNQISQEIWADYPDVYHAINAIELTKNPKALFSV